MSTVIYIDRLLAVNLLLCAVLILSSARISGADIGKKGLFAGSVLGSLSSLAIFLPDLPIALSILLKLAISLVICFAAFFPRSVRSFFKVWLSFVGVNAVFAGAMLAFELLVSPDSLVYINGTVYFDVSALMLCLLFVICYILISLYSKYAQRRSRIQDVIQLSIELNGVVCVCTALVDTGATLTESFSGRPVVVAEKCVAAGILSRGELEAVCAGSADLPERIVTRFRLVPFKALGGNGMIPAVRVDTVRAVINGKERCAENVYLGIADSELSNGEYRAIAGAALFEYE